ncbi:MAG TPA: hypothetical protein VNI01_03940 [Elusimicrobiota bacterium]|nr:hypothetical protein [Elusimicrobiota bacterium]
MEPALIAKLLGQTRLVRPPQKLLSTFGATRIEYHLVSPVDDLPNKTRLREGRVVSERPSILTPELLQERFEGFGEDSREFSEWINARYRDVLRALEYRFKNLDLTTRVLSEDFHAIAGRIREDVDARQVAHAAVIECPDSAWSLALMNLTLEQAARSFPVNVKDLDARGMFAADRGQDARRRREVESLLERARTDPALREAAGRKLREYGLFSEYEDRFLALFGS